MAMSVITTTVGNTIADLGRHAYQTSLVVTAVTT